ncbi:hypothetical protein LSUB1_G001765 [Lachnellula subtilissima]|uniref:DUF1760-domain-containing protein n=1 Tax=Lachnellula subtilissima TaxID=602034 RepID=A0A8H8RY05_9HELO|nr:hypothetical protein LSUB1_G001765 [Lachnellula subtilissima]
MLSITPPSNGFNPSTMSNMPPDGIKAITESLPPATDYLTYLTILESQLSADILPALNDILQDAELTQNIGWDLIHLLLPLPGAEKCLGSIARLGNPREVVLKVTESLHILDLDAVEEGHDVEDEDKAAKEEDNTAAEEGKIENTKKPTPEPTNVDKFCILVNLLAILHPRIKTKYPSRFLSTSLMSILAAFRPSNQATLAVVSFVHTISGKKRPPLPGRQSTLSIKDTNPSESDPSAPDPEAHEDADPQEGAIQTKLLQSFVTHVLQDYANTNSLEWATRLQESFDPTKVVAGKKSLGESFREEPTLQGRDTLVGQLVALARDLGMSDYTDLFDTIYKTEDETGDDDEENEEANYPTSPADIPLSKAGSLFLITCYIFASILFESKSPPPKLSIFPDHAKLVKQFIGTDGPANIGNEDSGVIDAILAIGLWLEHNNNFVSGPLEDEDFLQHLQSLSLLSANTPSSTLRYAAHVLTSTILHAHPVDRLRLTFITDTLEHCPYENLKASAVSWLKEEIITAYERKSNNIFGSKVALSAAQPYLFPDASELGSATAEELVHILGQSFSFHMAVVNFVFLISGENYAHVVPPGMLSVVEEIYLGPLRAAQVKALTAFEAGEPESTFDTGLSGLDLQLLGERISMCSAKIDV